MNYSIVFYIIGWILNFEAAFMALPTAVALIYRESEVWCFLATMAVWYAGNRKIRSFMWRRALWRFL